MAHKHMGFHTGGGLGPTFPIDVVNGDKHLNIDGQLKRNSSTRHNWVQPALSHMMVLLKNLLSVRFTWKITPQRKNPLDK